MIAGLPAYIMAWFSCRPAGRPAAVIMAFGIGLVAAGWLALELRDAVPNRTFVAGQAGGVWGETAAFVLVGSLLAVRTMLRARNSS